MGTHAKLCPPSGWDRWSVCPGSVDHQENDSTEYTDEGTAAHLLASTALKQGLAAADFIGTTIWVPDPQGYEEGELERFLAEGEEAPLTGRVFEVDFPMADPVQVYMDQVLDHEADYLQFETRVPIEHITKEPDGAGTADVLRATGRTLAAHDLKFGQGYMVMAKNNGQALLYLLGGVLDLAWLGDFDKFEVHIHQPRLGHYDVWEFDLATLLEWESKIKQKARAVTVDGDRHFQAGPAACKFCSIRKTCKVREDFIHDGIAEGFPIYDEEDEGLPQCAIDLKYVEFVEDWCKDKWSEALDLLRQNPDAIPGWGIFPGRGSRKFKDEKAERTAVRRLRKLGKPLDDIKPRKPCTPAGAQNLIGKKVYDAEIAELVEWVPGNPTLGRDTGKREKVNSAEAMGFSDLGD